MGEEEKLNAETRAEISRREFARRVVVASAGVAGAVTVGTTAALAATGTELISVEQTTQGPPLPKLSAEGQAEATQRVQMILAQYGGRFSEAQKADLQRLSVLAQPQLERLRAYAVENGDGTALYLKPLIEREKKPVTIPTAGAVKKP